MSVKVSSEALTTVLNATLAGVDGVIHAAMKREQPSLIQAPLIQPELGVLIGLTHGVRGRLILQASRSVFSALGQSMYGMVLEGEMLESYVGELGNMVAGNMATSAAEQGMSIEISPPTVIVGETKLSGFGTALRVPIAFDEIGKLDIILVIDSE